jgi:hypothetical protein
MRKIREEERRLVTFLLQHLHLKLEDYPFKDEVDPYEGDKMGSISLGGDVSAYDGDLIQVRYIDVDQVPVVITLTKDTKGQLLDLDFWKEDFTKLIAYPRPEQLEFM